MRAQGDEVLSSVFGEMEWLQYAYCEQDRFDECLEGKCPRTGGDKCGTEAFFISRILTALRDAGKSLEMFEEEDFGIEWCFWRRGDDNVMILQRESGDLMEFLEVVANMIKRKKPLLHLKERIQNLSVLPYNNSYL